VLLGIHPPDDRGILAEAGVTKTQGFAVQKFPWANNQIRVHSAGG